MQKNMKRPEDTGNRVYTCKGLQRDVAVFFTLEIIFLSI
jgi:hypothetical protein